MFAESVTQIRNEQDINHIKTRFACDSSLRAKKKRETRGVSD